MGNYFVSLEGKRIMNELSHLIFAKLYEVSIESNLVVNIKNDFKIQLRDSCKIDFSQFKQTELIAIMRSRGYHDVSNNISGFINKAQQIFQQNPFPNISNNGNFVYSFNLLDLNNITTTTTATNDVLINDKICYDEAEGYGYYPFHVIPIKSENYKLDVKWVSRYGTFRISGFPRTVRAYV